MIFTAWKRTWIHDSLCSLCIWNYHLMSTRYCVPLVYFSHFVVFNRMNIHDEFKTFTRRTKPKTIVHYFLCRYNKNRSVRLAFFRFLQLNERLQNLLQQFSNFYDEIYILKQCCHFNNSSFKYRFT